MLPVATLGAVQYKVQDAAAKDKTASAAHSEPVRWAPTMSCTLASIVQYTVCENAGALAVNDRLTAHKQYLVVKSANDRPTQQRHMALAASAVGTASM